jgi:phosphatidylserine/phosphatidylglycerophosphate/cardiolipin synthase-like enzyme
MHARPSFWLALVWSACTATEKTEEEPTTEPAFGDEVPDSGGPEATHTEDLILPDGALLTEISQAIPAATEEIRVVQYTLWDGEPVDSLMQALQAAARRGVHVQVLADEEADTADRILAELEEAGAETKLDDPEVTTHNKFWVIDGVVYSGSHNLSVSALTRNREVSARTSDPATVARFNAYFEAIWEEPGSDPAMDAPDGAVQASFDNAAIDAWKSCMAGAETRVDLALYALAWDDRYPGGSVDTLLSELEGAVSRGVAVRVLLDQSDWIVENGINTASVQRLSENGVQVRGANPIETLHAKAMICDEESLIADSNWSYSGLELYHGASLRMPMVDPLDAWFESLWSESEALVAARHMPHSGAHEPIGERQ